VKATYIPEEEARTALGMAWAMTRGDIEGARHLWDTTEHQDLVAMGFAVMLSNVIDQFSAATEQSSTDFYAGMQQAIEDTRNS
jgi:hypothetical protein